MRRSILALVVLLAAGCAPMPAVEAPSREPTAPTPSAATPAPTSSVTPTAEPTPTPEPFLPRTASVNVSGDLLWHNSLWVSAELDAKKGRFDFRPQLRSIKKYVSAADLAICHSEVPFAKKDGPFRNYPLFAAPQEIAPALVATGWDLCTTASNHTMDQGWEGLVRTIEVHHDHGILTSGSWATEEDRNTPVIFTTDGGVRIAVISQTFGLNGLPKAKGKPWSVQLLDAKVAIADAKRAKKAGADIVLVHMHAGDEYSSRINSQQRDFAAAVTASPDVDMVFGQHAHVVQPIDKVNDKWVIYGAGNLIASSGPAQPRTYDGFMAQVTFEEKEEGGFVATAAEFAPTMITKKSGNTPARVYLIPDELTAGTKRAAEMKASAERTRKTVRSLDVEGLTERK